MGRMLINNNKIIINLRCVVMVLRVECNHAFEINVRISLRQIDYISSDANYNRRSLRVAHNIRIRHTKTRGVSLPPVSDASGVEITHKWNTLIK